MSGYEQAEKQRSNGKLGLNLTQEPLRHSPGLWHYKIMSSGAECLMIDAIPDHVPYSNRRH